MNKKLLVALAAVSLSLTILPASKAEEVKPATLAIIDTAVNSSLPDIKNNIIYEVCILDWQSCSNKLQYQEGAGAASMPINQMMLNGFEHGTEMAYTAVKTNPNIKIVFIRFVGATVSGSRQTTNENSIVNAMTWVLFNKDRFNIKAVAISQSHHNLGTGANYCPNTPLTNNIVNNLISNNIAVFFPAGNLKDTSRISWPACITNSLAVSASAYGDGPALYTNYDPLATDFFARGDINSILPNGTKANVAGTSVSNQVAAASYIALANKYPSYTYDQLVALLKTKTISLVSRTIKNAKIIDPIGALNG